MVRNKGLAIVAAVGVFVGGASLVARGQTTPKPVSEQAEVTKKFTIEAIDYQSRMVTLKDDKGKLDTIVAGPDVTRFNELKAGDKVTFKYTESVLFAIRPSGGAATPTDTTSMQRDTGAKPGGTVTRQLTASVVVTDIDQSVPSVTVKTNDGKIMSFKVKDKKNIEHMKAGDHVDITYKQGLAIRVEQ